MTVEQQQQQQQGSTPVLPFHKMILLPDDRLVAAFGKYLAVMNVETSRVIAGPADLKLSESAVAMPEESFATSQIIALDYSPEANLLVVIADDKSLITYDCTKWTVVYRVVCPKRANDVKFVEKGTKILIADKFGDVSRYVLFHLMIDCVTIVLHGFEITNKKRADSTSPTQTRRPRC